MSDSLLPPAIAVPNGINLLKIPKTTGHIGDGGFFGLFVLPRNGPKIEVNINHDFYMAETCITSEQWLSLESKDPSKFTFDPSCPVESVSRSMALSYIQKLNNNFPELEGISGTFRLPSEVEWEYSARAGDSSKRPGPDYSVGGMISSPTGGGLTHGSLDDFAERGGKTRPVLADSANAWGLRGMVGGVAEHCIDPYIETNRGLPKDGAPRKGRGLIVNGDEMFVQRGGSWDQNPSDLTYFWKAGIGMHDCDGRDGFRVVWTPQ